jgi:hypothetical protein
MTKEELFELMEDESNSGKLEYFKNIPESLRTSEVAERWIEYCQENIAGCGADDCYAEIMRVKPEIMTDRIRLLAVRLSVNTLFQISPEETPAYKEIALLGIKNSGKGIGFLHKEFHTLEMLRDIIEQSPERIDCPATKKWVGALITPEMKAELLETNLKFALGLPEGDVTREQWHKLLTENPQYYCQEVDRRGRLQLLADFVKAGGWPDSVQYTFEPVGTINEALKCFMDAKVTEPASALYKAKLHTFPIEEVLQATDQRSLVETLTKIYPEDVLRRNMKHNRALRSYLLENDLGM